MARKRRKSNSRRSRQARSRKSVRRPNQVGSVADGPEAVAAPAAVDTPVSRSTDPAESPPDAGVTTAVAQAPVVSAPAKTAWPTRRKRSHLVELPVQELDHVRGDLARIGLLSLGMVFVLIVLTFVLQ